MKIRNRQKLLTIAAISTVILLVGDKMVLSPLIRVWKDRSQRISELTKSVAKGTVLLDREKTIRRRWDEMRTNALPSDTSVAESEVFKSVDRWARESQIGFNGIKTTSKRNADDYITLECRADAVGTIENLTHFLYNLERDPLPLRMEDIEILARDSQGQQLSLAVRFTGLLLLPEDK